MITTKQINVNLSKEKLKLRRVTTRDVDAGVRVEPPREPIKIRGVSTTTLPDVADIVEKKRRDDIAVEKKISPVIKTGEEDLKKLNKQFVFVEIDDLIQAVSRRELWPSI